jgi:hypothetical protein
VTELSLTQQERKDLWAAGVSVGAGYDGPEADHELYRVVEAVLRKRKALATNEAGVHLFDEIAGIANHWAHPSGDFRYDLRELAQTLRQSLKRLTGVDVLESELWNPRGAEPIAHHVAYTQAITDHNTQWVCACGHVGDSYASTVATRFGEHLRRQHELTAPSPA